MPQSNPSNRRVRVPQTTGDTAAFQTATPIDARSAGRKGSTGAAFAFADMLRSTLPIAKEFEAGQARKGAADQIKGTVDEDNESRHYRNAVNQLQARADWVQDETEFEESLKDLDLDNISQSELDGHIDGLFQSKYSGIELEDETVAAELLPKLDAFRKKAYADVVKRQRANEEARIGSNLTMISEDAYDAVDRAAGEQFDYFGLHDQVRNVKPRSETNEAYFKVITDLAIRNGDPDLIRGIPDRWSDGTPTFTSIPDFNERVLSAELRAVAAKAQLQAAAAKALDDQREARFNEVSIAAMEMIMAGDNVGAQALIYELAQEGGQDAKDILNMHKGLSAMGGVFEALPQDAAQVADATARVYSGQMSNSELADLFGKGVFGLDDQGISTYRTLVSHLATRAKSDPETNRQFTFNVGLLKSRYNPKTKGELGEINTNVAELRDTALKMYDRLVHGEGMDPNQAFLEVSDAMDKRFEKIPGAGITMGSVMSPAQAIGHLISGDIPATQARKFGVTLQLVDEAFKSGAINALQYEDIERKLAGEY